jgi:nicotinate dehydrogenase subunit A
MDITFKLNGKATRARIDDEAMPLLYLLREAPLALNGPSFGCGLGQCGACTVHVNGEAVRSCVTPASSIAGMTITTLEGLGTADKPHRLQKAFIDEGAAQCGYCANGMIMQAAAMLTRNKAPTEVQIREELQNNLCRCGTHGRIVKAVQRAAAAG